MPQLETFCPHCGDPLVVELDTDALSFDIVGASHRDVMTPPQKLFFDMAVQDQIEEHFRQLDEDAFEAAIDHEYHRRKDEGEI